MTAMAGSFVSEESQATGKKCDKGKAIILVREMFLKEIVGFDPEYITNAGDRIN